MTKSRLIANIYLWGLGLIALSGGVMSVYITAKGLYGASDSVGYLVSARNFIKGLGVGYYFPDGRFYQLTVHPPLYVLSLGALAFFKIDLLLAARILDAVYFVATIFLAGALFLRFSSLPSLSPLAGLMIVAFPALSILYLSVMTESLYFLLFLGSLFCLLAYFKERLYRWLILAALLTGLAIITRYDGIPFIPAAVIGLLVFDKGSLGQKIKKALLFSVLAGLPLLLFGFSIHFNLERPSLSREVQFDWPTLLKTFGQFRVSILSVIWGWIPLHDSLPIVKSRSRTIILLLIVAGVLLAAFFAARRNRHLTPPAEDGDLQIFSLSGLMILLTAVFLTGTTLAVGLPARMDDRQLLPIYVSAVLGLLAAFAGWFRAWSRDRAWPQVLAWLVAGFFIAWYQPWSFLLPNSIKPSGSLAYSWRNSALIKAVQALPEGTPVISNKTDVLLLWADRPAYDFVSALNTGFIQANAIYGSDPTDRAQVAFRQQGAALVIFGNVMYQELENAFGEPGRLRGKTIFDGLVTAGKYPDGTIYFYPK